MPIDDELSAIEFLNENEERSRSPVCKRVKDAIVLISAALPATGIPLGLIKNALDRREASNRAELFSVLLATVRRNSDRLGALIAKKEAHSHFFTDEFPGLVVEAVRRAEAVRSKERVRRFAAILAHSIELGPKDGPDYVEEMLRIATELSDWDVKVLATASEVFLVHQQRPLITNPLHARMEADSVVAARAWLSMDSGVSRDELASIGAKLQSFGLANRIEGQTGDTSSYLMLERGRRFLEYICAAE